MEKIGFYCSSISWGGLEMNFVRYALWLNECDFEVIIYCVENSKIAERLVSEPVRLQFVHRNKKNLDLVNAFRIKNQFKHDGVTKIWIRDRRDFSVLGIAKTLSRNAFKIIYQQAMQFSSSKKDLIHTWQYKKIDAWIAPLNFLKQQVIDFTHFPPAKIYQIPLALDPKNQGIPVSKNEARAALKLENNRIYLGIIGRLDPLKGQLFVVKALSELRKKYPNLELLLIGEQTVNEGDAYMAELTKTIQSLHLNDVVHFRPFMKNIEVAYSALDVFVMASKGETFGMVTIETMAFGIPVIGTNASGTPEILGFGEFGTLYEVNDAADFIQQLSLLLSDPENTAQKAALAMKTALKNYNKTAVVEQLVTLLKKV